jgi:hypothetical protein
MFFNFHEPKHAPCALLKQGIRMSSNQETFDHYGGVIAHLCPVQRVVTWCDDLQWMLQRRKKGGAERPWRGVGYFRTRDALIRVCARLCGRIDPDARAILVALPAQIGGVLWKGVWDAPVARCSARPRQMWKTTCKRTSNVKHTRPAAICKVAISAGDVASMPAAPS